MNNPLLVKRYNHLKEKFEAYFGDRLIAIDPEIAIADQITNTALDFQLELKPVLESCGGELKAYEPKRFLVNSSSGEIFDVVGKNWTPHQPKEVLTLFQHWCSDQSKLNLTHVGQMNAGRIVYALADYPEVIDFGGDITIAKVLLSNFNKLGFSTRIDLFTYREICSNGLTIRNMENSIRLSHAQSLGISDRLSTSLDKLHANFATHQETMKQLTQVTLNKQEAQAMLIRNFGDPDKDLEEQPQIVWSALQLFEGKAKGSEFLSAYNTAYGLLQATTEYLNHHSRKTSTHLSSVLYGNKNHAAQKMIQSLSHTYL
jgi:phage/plasmid-like protein (TIGR03299 family)